VGTKKNTAEDRWTGTQEGLLSFFLR